MSGTETHLFWEAAEKYLADTVHEDLLDAYLGSADSLASLPFLSLCPFAVEEYDERLEKTLSSWEHNNWGISSSLKNHRLTSPSASHEGYSTMPVIEFCTLKERPMSDTHKSLAPDEVEQANDKSDRNEHRKSITDEEGVIEDEDSTDNENGTDDEDSTDNEDGTNEEGVVEDENEDRGIIEDAGVIEEEDVLSERNATDLPDEKKTRSNTVPTSSDTFTYSCRGCRKPDNECMIACDNSEVHGDNEAWYHYQCVQISQDSVPEGQWYCPPCRTAVEASNHASNQDPLKSRAAKKPTVSKGPYFSKSKATKASGNKVTKASQVRGKPAGKDAEVPRSSKKAQPKKNVRDTQLQDSEEDDFEGDEPVKIPRKTKKAKESSGRKPPWRDPIEEQRVIELVKEIQSDPAIDKKISFSEDKWKLIRQLLEQRYGFIRTLNGIKNHWTRKLRAQSGYDERGEGHKNPTKMRTSVESPEERKRRRQAKAQAKAQSSTAQRKARAQKQNDVREELTCVEANPPEGEGENIDGRPHGPVLDERLQYFREDEYDFSPHKNKGKRKRDDEEDEYDLSPYQNKGKRQRDD